MWKPSLYLPSYAANTLRIYLCGHKQNNKNAFSVESSTDWLGGQGVYMEVHIRQF